MTMRRTLLQEQQQQQQVGGLFSLDVQQECNYPAIGGQATSMRVSVVHPADGTRVFGICKRGVLPGTPLVLEGLALQIVCPDVKAECPDTPIIYPNFDNNDDVVAKSSIPIQPSSSTTDNNNVAEDESLPLGIGPDGLLLTSPPSSSPPPVETTAVSSSCPYKFNLTLTTVIIACVATILLGIFLFVYVPVRVIKARVRRYYTGAGAKPAPYLPSLARVHPVLGLCEPTHYLPTLVRTMLLLLFEGALALAAASFEVAPLPMACSHEAVALSTADAVRAKSAAEVEGGYAVDDDNQLILYGRVRWLPLVLRGISAAVLACLCHYFAATIIARILHIRKYGGGGGHSASQQQQREAETTTKKCGCCTPKVTYVVTLFVLPFLALAIVYGVGIYFTGAPLALGAWALSLCISLLVLWPIISAIAVFGWREDGSTGAPLLTPGSLERMEAAGKSLPPMMPPQQPPKPTDLVLASPSFSFGGETMTESTTNRGGDAFAEAIAAMGGGTDRSSNGLTSPTSQPSPSIRDAAGVPVPPVSSPMSSPLRDAAGVPTSTSGGVDFFSTPSLQLSPRTDGFPSSNQSPRPSTFNNKNDDYHTPPAIGAAATGDRSAEETRSLPPSGTIAAEESDADLLKSALFMLLATDGREGASSAASSAFGSDTARRQVRSELRRLLASPRGRAVARRWTAEQAQALEKEHGGKPSRTPSEMLARVLANVASDDSMLSARSNATESRGDRRASRRDSRDSTTSSLRDELHRVARKVSSLRAVFEHRRSTTPPHHLNNDVAVAAASAAANAVSAALSPREDAAAAVSPPGANPSESSPPSQGSGSPLSASAHPHQLLYDFVAEAPGELSVGKGEEVFVVDEGEAGTSSGWSLVRMHKDGSTVVGYVPSSFLTASY